MGDLSQLKVSLIVIYQTFKVQMGPHLKTNELES